LAFCHIKKDWLGSAWGIGLLWFQLMRGTFSASSEANRTHVAARSALLKQMDLVVPIVERYILLLFEAYGTPFVSFSALLKQMDQVLQLGFLPYLKGLDWQCMRYWTGVIPIDAQYILLLF
jgi:hypothetical protein